MTVPPPPRESSEATEPWARSKALPPLRRRTTRAPLTLAYSCQEMGADLSTGTSQLCRRARARLGDPRIVELAENVARAPRRSGEGGAASASAIHGEFGRSKSHPRLKSSIFGSILFIQGCTRVFADEIVGMTTPRRGSADTLRERAPNSHRRPERE